MIKLPTSPVSYPMFGDTDDLRFGSLIATDPSAWSGADVLILGIPTDEGIHRNGGRIGASQAPAAIREKLAKLTVSAAMKSLRIADLGDAVASTLEEQHEIAKQAAAWSAKENKFLISIGGGHDVTYPLAAGISSAIPELSLINIDAHADVREKKNGQHHSGSSFRLLIEEGHIRGENFAEFGLQHFAVADTHHEWLCGNRASVTWLSEFENCREEFHALLQRSRTKTYVSFDIDAVCAADAPGSSAPSPIGITASDALAIARLSGSDPNTIAIDIVEVSPPYDRDGQTTKLAALMIGEILTGYIRR